MQNTENSLEAKEKESYFKCNDITIYNNDILKASHLTQ